MLSLKALKPTLREKKRYIVYQIEGKCNPKQIQNKLIQELKNKLGVFDTAKAGILPIDFDQKSMKGIMRVNHKMIDSIRALFVLISDIDSETKIIVSTIGVSGILKKAKEKYFQDENVLKKTEMKN